MVRLQQEGTIRPDIDVKVAVTSFFASLTAYTILYETINGIPRDVEQDEYTNTVADIFIRGIETRSQNTK